MKLNKPIYILIFLASTLLFGACAKKTERALVVAQLRAAAKLSTVEYVLTKVVSANETRLFGKDLFFFANTKAYVKAGIDLNKLMEEDIVIENSKIKITLPAIEIVNFSYPAEGFVVVEKYTDELSLLAWSDIDVEKKDDYFRQAETDIRNNINDLGIKETAEKNTIKLFTQLLKSSGFEEIYISFKSSPELLEENSLLKDENKQLEAVIIDLKTELKKAK